jgi:ribonuclease HI
MKRIKKIPTVTCNLSKTGRLPFTTSIPEDRDSSIEEARNAKEEVQIFSDGSATNGKVGAAAILTRPGQPEQALHYHLGPNNKHTVHKAELVGILLGIHLVKTKRKGKTSFVIGVDNQAALKAFKIRPKKACPSSSMGNFMVCKHTTKSEKEEQILASHQMDGRAQGH